MKLRPEKWDYLFVGIQLLLFVIYVWPPVHLPFEPALWMQIAGFALTARGLVYLVWPILQLNRALTMFPTPKAEGKLITTGAFARVRHPTYAGIFWGGVGIGVVYGDAVRVIIAGMLLLLFYFKSNYEEKRLMQVFPDYADYRTRTGKFFSRIFT